jgi:hypothetical protein
MFPHDDRGNASGYHDPAYLVFLRLKLKLRVGIVGMRRLLERIAVGTGICVGAAASCAPAAWAAGAAGTASASAGPMVSSTASAPAASCDNSDLRMANETSNGGVTTVYSASSLAVDTVLFSNDGSAGCPDAGLMVQVFPTASSGDHEPTLEWRVAGGSWHSAYLAWENYSSGDPGWQTGVFSFGLSAHTSKTIELGLRFPSSAPDNALYTAPVYYSADGTAAATSFGTQEAWDLIDTSGATGGGSGGSGGSGSGGTSTRSSSPSTAHASSPLPSRSVKSASPTPAVSQSASATPTSSSSSPAAYSAVTPAASPSGSLLADTRATPSDTLSFTAASVAVAVFAGLAALPLLRRRRTLPRSGRR